MPSGVPRDEFAKDCIQVFSHVPSSKTWKRILGATFAIARIQPANPVTKLQSSSALILSAVVTDAHGDIIYSCERGFVREAHGIVATHRRLRIHDGHQAQGHGTFIFENVKTEYRKHQVVEIRTSAEWIGQYVWPYFGFELVDPNELIEIIDEFIQWFSEHEIVENLATMQGVSGDEAWLSDLASGLVAEAAIQTLQELSRFEVLEFQVGKEFLLYRGNGYGYSALNLIYNLK